MTRGRLLAAVQGATKAVAKGRNSSGNSGRKGIAGGWNTRCGPIRSQNRPLRLNCLPTTSEGQPFRRPADIAVANTCWQPPGRLPAIRLPVLGCEWCSGQLNLRPRPPSMCAPRGHLRVLEKLGRRAGSVSASEARTYRARTTTNRNGGQLASGAVRNRMGWRSRANRPSVLPRLNSYLNGGVRSHAGSAPRPEALLGTCRRPASSPLAVALR